MSLTVFMTDAVLMGEDCLISHMMLQVIPIKNQTKIVI